MKAKLDSDQEGIKVSKEEVIAEMKVWREEIMSYQEPGRTEIRTGQEKLEATDLQVILEEEEAAVEIVGALEDRYLAIRRRQQPKTRSQANGGSRHKLATARRQFTGHAVPALRKGPGKTSGSGIRGRRRRQELILGSKKMFYEALGLEVVKRAVGFSVRIRKTSVKTLWRSWPQPKGKETLLAAWCRRCRAPATSGSFLS
jgi:hypothetical protein